MLVRVRSLLPRGTCILPLTQGVPVNAPRSIRPSNLVFVQYLFALAVVDACQALDPVKAWATKVKLKWPNDIYGEFPVGEASERVELKKVGGILVNTNFGGNTADVIIGMCHSHASRTSYRHSRTDAGCGLNVLNEPPIGSLAQLEALTRGQGASSGLSVERVTAAVVTAFERIWNQFLTEENDGFYPFMDQYTRSWLHSWVKRPFLAIILTESAYRGQTVTLATTEPHTTVRIVGITPDYGLLRTEPLGGGRYIDLQPDGNSFDMMKGLIKTKTS